MRTGTIIFLCFVMLFFSWKCGGHWWGGSIRAKGEIITHSYDVRDFNGVEIWGAFNDVKFIQSNQTEVVFEGHENLIDVMEVEVNGSILEIRIKNKISRIRGRMPKITIYGPVLEKIKLSGATSFKSELISNDSQIDISSSGASELDLEVKSPEVKISLSGAGKVKVKGMTRRLDAKISGAAAIRAFDLLSEETDLHITGAGKAEVYASKTLKIDATGASSVQYKGNPQVNSNVSGATSLRQVK